MREMPRLTHQDLRPHRLIYLPSQRKQLALDKINRHNKLHTIRTDTCPAQPKQLASNLNWEHFLMRQNMRDICTRQNWWISHDTRGWMSISFWGRHHNRCCLLTSLHNDGVDDGLHRPTRGNDCTWQHLCRSSGLVVTWLYSVSPLRKWRSMGRSPKMWIWWRIPLLPYSSRSHFTIMSARLIPFLL